MLYKCLIISYNLLTSRCISDLYVSDLMKDGSCNSRVLGRHRIHVSTTDEPFFVLVSEKWLAVKLAIFLAYQPLDLLD